MRNKIITVIGLFDEKENIIHTNIGKVSINNINMWRQSGLWYFLLVKGYNSYSIESIERA